MRWLLGLILSMLPWVVAAQTPDDEPYYPYEESELRFEEPYSDSLLFYRAIQLADDLYGRLTRYALPRVTIARRGESYRGEESTLHGLKLDYRYERAIRALGGEEFTASGAAMGLQSLGRVGGVQEYRFTEALPLNPYEATVRLTDRNYRVGATVRMHRDLGAWQTGLVVDGRLGRDARIEGLYTHAFTFGARLSRAWGERSRLTLFAALPVSHRGLRSASTEEAFTLTDDPYYNPAWGFQQGEVRSARERGEWLPFVVGEWEQSLGASTTLRAALAFQAGKSRQSALGWYDARTPLPDNYRYMPSYTADRAAEEAWLAGDSRYTQIAWDELIVQNRLGDGEAIYALEDRVEAPMRAEARVSFTTRLARTTLDYGVRLDWDRTRYYKEMNDLLGADYLVDIDQYLIDDDSYRNLLENNLKDPSRKIFEGDRFGYDYALRRLESTLWLRTAWQSDRLRLDVAAEVGRGEAQREGFYEKELFAGSGSYGPSRAVSYTPYRLKAGVAWAVSPLMNLELNLATGAELPRVEQLFVQPLYNNRTILNPQTERYHAAQIRLRRRYEKLDLELSAYCTLRLDGVESRRYFDDLAGLYADLSVQGIGRASYGLEGALEWRPAYRWTVTAAAAWGVNRYVRDPLVTVLADADNQLVEKDAVSHMRDCRVGGAPELTAALTVNYYAPKGWGVALSGGYAGGRYVDPSLLRRTDRVARQNGVAEEAFRDFTTQERLEDALTLDLSLYKRFYFARHALLLSLHANNLLGQEQIAYGYESLRSMRVGKDTGALRMPQPSRYLYAMPRTVSLRISWQF